MGGSLENSRDNRGAEQGQAPSIGDVGGSGKLDASLLGFVESVAGDSHVRVEEDLGDGYVRLRSSEAERRQAQQDIRCVEDVVIESLRNARDAGAGNIFVATTRDGDDRVIAVLDDGCGIPAHMHEKIFEPRVTSKLDSMTEDRWGIHGRGMALYSIRSNVSKAVVKSSAVNMGSAFLFVADTEVLPEKTDQSSVPQLQRDDEGNLQVVRGPHNINRSVLEFSIESLHDVDVYLGSPSEIAATLIDFGRRRTSEADLLFSDDAEDLPVCQRLAGYGSAADLVQRCHDLGLEISERTAHRIIHGQIAPVRTYYKMVTAKKGKTEAILDFKRDYRSLKISKEDMGSFSRKLEDAFESLGEQYYISLADEPKITIGKDSIKVVFPIDKE